MTDTKTIDPVMVPITLERPLETTSVTTVFPAVRNGVLLVYTLTYEQPFDGRNVF